MIAGLRRLFLWIALFLANNALANDSFYVWQQLWLPAVCDAVVSEDSTEIYPLICVVPASGEPELVKIPWGEISKSRHEFVPVIRIPLSAFNRKDLLQVLGSIVDDLQTSIGSFSEIQFDLDCPTRRLNEYSDLIADFRDKFKQLKLSVTVLPTHLGSRDFARLADSVDYYVLQVHGLDVPKNVKDRAELLNRSVADLALKRADKLGRPFKVALPTYAYELNFYAESGKFSHLTAESGSSRGGFRKKRIAASFFDLVELQDSIKNIDCAQGVIWFRLPVSGDRLCWPRATISELQKGEIPEARVRCKVNRINEKTIEILVLNENVIQSNKVEVVVDWPIAFGAFDLFDSVETREDFSVMFPRKMVVQLPAPGEWVKVGWFQVAAPSEPKIGVNLL